MTKLINYGADILSRFDFAVLWIYMRWTMPHLIYVPEIRNMSFNRRSKVTYEPASTFL